MGRFNKIVSKRGNETEPVVSVKCLGYQFSKEYLIRGLRTDSGSCFIAAESTVTHLILMVRMICAKNSTHKHSEHAIKAINAYRKHLSIKFDH